MSKLKRGLRAELALTLEAYTQDENSGTPGFILARYVTDSLKAFDKATAARDDWYEADDEDSIEVGTFGIEEPDANV